MREIGLPGEAAEALLLGFFRRDYGAAGLYDLASDGRLSDQQLLVAAVTLIWAIPNLSPIFNVVLLVWGLLICLIYALFAGWIMKISHLRKSMNFSSEAFYNIWRIAVRVVLPVGIILAIIAVLGQFV